MNSILMGATLIGDSGGRQGSADPSAPIGARTLRPSTDIATPSVGMRDAPKIRPGGMTHREIFDSLRPAHWRLRDSLMD